MREQAATELASSSSSIRKLIEMINVLIMKLQIHQGVHLRTKAATSTTRIREWNLTFQWFLMNLLRDVNCTNLTLDCLVSSFHSHSTAGLSINTDCEYPNNILLIFVVEKMQFSTPRIQICHKRFAQSHLIDSMFYTSCLVIVYANFLIHNSSLLSISTANLIRWWWFLIFTTTKYTNDFMCGWERTMDKFLDFRINLKSIDDDKEWRGRENFHILLFQCP